MTLSATSVGDTQAQPRVDTTSWKVRQQGKRAAIARAAARLGPDPDDMSSEQLLAQADRALAHGDTDLYDALCGLAAKAG
jgi:hypothetical protein